MIKRVLFIILVLFLKISMFSQEKDNIKLGKSVLSENGIKNNSNINLNRNGYYLKLNKKQAKKIAKIILYDVYGRFNIRQQKPFFSCLVDGFWIFRGTIKERKKGGVFVIVINSKNGSVEYLSHGK